MPKQRKSVEYVVDAAKGVNSWLDLLGRNCCAGRSYRRMDAVKESAGCEEAVADGESVDGRADEPAPARRASA